MMAPEATHHAKQIGSLAVSGIKERSMIKGAAAMTIAKDNAIAIATRHRINR